MARPKKNAEIKNFNKMRDDILFIIGATSLFVSILIAGIYCLLPEPKGCAFIELGLFLTLIGAWGTYCVIRLTVNELIARIKKVNEK